MSPDNFEGTLKFDPALLQDSQPAVEQGHYLVLISGAEPGLRVEVGMQPVTVGRSPEQTLVFAGDSALSRRHAQVSLVDGSLVVEDLGSTNGTYVEGARIDAPRRLTEGAIVKMGEQTLAYERRSVDDVRRTEALERDLARASGYVKALLPEPLTSGPIRTDWCFVPSAKLGGDALGYFWLDDRSLAIFLFDVSGHGVGAAMHSVTVLNVLRQRALPDVDWHDPGAVLATLNDRFPMDSHGGMLFTAWYGVYDTGSRTMTYSAAGHHPAFLVMPGSARATPLGVKALMIGAVAGLSYRAERADVPAGSRLYVFSDGVFEITARDGRRWTMADFVPLLTEPPAAGLPQSEHLYRAVQAAASGQLEDDCSVLVATFL
jgi:serine phosphatase RsbU (regulator of sigma subunit)